MGRRTVLVFVLQIQYPSVKYKWTQLNTIEEFHYVGHVWLDKWQETYVQSIGKKKHQVQNCVQYFRLLRSPFCSSLCLIAIKMEIEEIQFLGGFNYAVSIHIASHFVFQTSI